MSPTTSNAAGRCDATVKLTLTQHEMRSLVGEKHVLAFRVVRTPRDVTITFWASVSRDLPRHQAARRRIPERVVAKRHADHVAAV
jgi:hypothetical protein